jgi:3-oxoacyl-[acyl-carrier protein] reductase
VIAAATAAAITELLRDPTPIGVLVNNAGVARDAPFPTLDRPSWELVTRTSIDGFYNVTQPLVMPMVRARWGRIINVSSVSGVIGNRGQVNYSAAKAALIGATRSLAQELAKRHVTVNAVAPGLIDTDMIQSAPVDELLRMIPMRRLGTADEVASLVAFLAGDGAAYITGQVIGINGGLA